MQNFGTKELTQYLKQAAELESSVYRQEMSIIKARKSLVKERTYKRHVDKPETRVGTIKKPVPPTPSDAKQARLLGILLCGWALVCFIISVMVTSIGPAIGGLCFLVIAQILFVSSKKGKQKDKVNAEKFEEQQKEYNRQIAAAEAEYNQQMAAYEKELNTQEKRYQIACADAEKRYLIASNEVSKLDAPLAETKALLERLYAADIIFPKYRNLVAMCTMYEYFVTGRCSELTGPNGAYNLYEAELRQNLIIDKLDKIIRKLDQIAQNQFTLYQELRKTNEIVAGIASDVKTLCKTTERIAEAATITAQCAHVTAQNTEALKYIMLIS